MTRGSGHHLNLLEIPVTRPIVFADPTFDPPPTADQRELALTAVPSIADFREFWAPLVDVDPSPAEFALWFDADQYRAA